MMQLSAETAAVLVRLAQGDYLKSHRYLDGTKVFQLHALNGGTTDIPRQVVDVLLNNELVSSNQKFPAATYMLTAQGRQLAETLSASD